MNIRHTVVIRTDLNLSRGLMSAQVAHIQDAFMRELLWDKKEPNMDQANWIKHPYLSVLAVDNPEELKILIAEAKEQGIDVHEWRDLIPSKNLNRSMPDVLVGASFGPTDMDRIKAITGTLPLA